MNRLNQIMNSSNKEYPMEIPTYSATGKALNPEIKIRRKKLAKIILLFSLLFSIIYLPSIIINILPKTKKTEGYIITPDSQAIKKYNELFSQAPDEDFDMDGITNDREQNIELTNPYDIDSDHDGASDYYEIYISKTAPNLADDNIVLDAQQKMDDEQGKTVSTPYRIENVILWADDYESKAKGGVIETLHGYIFHDFKGYAQFPNDTDIYVYEFKNGVRTLLPYLKEENAWRIDNSGFVEVYQEPLEEIVELDLFFHPFYLGSNFFTKAVSFILPQKGLFAASKKTIKDIDPDTNMPTTAEINTPVYESETSEWLKHNTNSLSDLKYVYSIIDENKCVPVSLYNQNDGEYIGIIYGYTYNGDLLIADPNSLEHIDTIMITEVGTKLLDDDDGFTLHTYFTWKGLGFSSSRYDRISFINIPAIKEEKKDIQQETAEPTNEYIEEQIPVTEDLTTENEALTEENTESASIETQTTESPSTEEPITSEIDESTTETTINDANIIKNTHPTKNTNVENTESNTLDTPSIK